MNQQECFDVVFKNAQEIFEDQTSGITRMLDEALQGTRCPVDTMNTIVLLGVISSLTTTALIEMAETKDQLFQVEELLSKMYSERDAIMGRIQALSEAAKMQADAMKAGVPGPISQHIH